MNGLKQFFQTKYGFWVTALIALTLLALGALALIGITQKPPMPPTGGSGQPKYGTVIIHGWDAKNQYGMTLGDTLTADQENAIAKAIQNDLLAKGIFKATYTVTVTKVTGENDEAKGIDLNRATLTLDEDKTIEYTVTINYLSDGKPPISMTDKSGNSIEVAQQYAQ